MTDTPPPSRPLYKRLGPGLITACVIIGPGSILTSSKVGSAYGFELLWVLVVAVILMMTYMTLGAKLGVAQDLTPAQLLEKQNLRWLAMVIGVAIFCISGAYQFGNNLGVHAAATQLLPEGTTWASKATIGIVIGANLLAIAFLFAFKDLYRWLERIMVVFVALMLGAFFINLFFAPPDVGQMIMGLIPSLPQSSEGSEVDWVPVLGWIGTTFITGVAYNQAYLVRQKGWKRENLKDGLLDARVGSVVSALITLMLLATAATALGGKDLKKVSDVAQQLNSLFGPIGETLFCIGLFCAAYSSYLVNSLIGGFLLADGFKLGVNNTDKWPRIFATAILLFGMIIALALILKDVSALPAVVFAQAITVVAAPLAGGVLWWLTSSKKVMGELKNGLLTNIVAGFGFLMLLALSSYLVLVKILPSLSKMLNDSPSNT